MSSPAPAPVLPGLPVSAFACPQDFRLSTRNAVFNPSFESSIFSIPTRWSVTNAKPDGGKVELGNSREVSAHTGSHYFHFLSGITGSDQSAAPVLSQKLKTDSSKSYLVSFWWLSTEQDSGYGADADALGEGFQVSWNEQPFSSAGNGYIGWSSDYVTAEPARRGDYVQLCMPMVAQGTGSDTLSFTGLQDFIIDDVAVQPVSTTSVTVSTTTYGTTLTTASTSTIYTTTYDATVYTSTITPSATTVADPTTTATVPATTTTTTITSCRDATVTFSGGCCPTAVLTPVVAPIGNGRRDLPVATPVERRAQRDVSPAATPAPGAVAADVSQQARPNGDYTYTYTVTSTISLATSTSYTEIDTITTSSDSPETLSTVTTLTTPTTTTTATITTGTTPTATATNCRTHLRTTFHCPNGGGVVNQARLLASETSLLNRYLSSTASAGPSPVTAICSGTSTYTYAPTPTQQGGSN